MRNIASIYLDVVTLLIDNCFPVLVISALMAIPLVAIEWFRKKMTPEIERVLVVFVISVIVLMGAYYSSRTFASLPAIGYAEYVMSPEKAQVAANEYWYHLYVAPFSQKDCYTSSSPEECAAWNKYFSWWKDMPLDERFCAFLVPIFFGLLTAWISVRKMKGGIKKLLSRYAHVQWA